MAIRNIRNSARMNYSDLIESREGFIYWSAPDLPDIPEQQDDIQYRWVSTDRLEELSNRYYGDTHLWWVIAIANGIEIHPTQLLPGDLLRIPSPRYVKDNLLNPNATANTLLSS